MFKCPKCGTEIGEVKEVFLSRSEMGVSALAGLGVGLIFAGSASILSLIGAVVVSGVSAILVQRLARRGHRVG